MGNRISQTLELIEANLNAFKKYNDTKKHLFTSSLYKKLNDFIAVLPFIVSHNHKKLPGYIENLSFSEGISGHAPDEKTKALLKQKWFRSDLPGFADLDGQSNKNPFVRMFAVMGSVGTVAYSRGSDFDFWVCFYKEDITPQMLNMYNQKLDAISEYCEKEFRIPVHFYLNEINDLRHNIFGEEDGGGFSTTVGALLKDEFFRSSIILAGKVPFWWAVPGGLSEKKYNLILQIAKNNNGFDPFIDIGGLKVNKKSSFLGAAFFQILKSLENPFKSILKIGLLRKYILESEAGGLFLAAELKKRIHRGLTSTMETDSYVYLFTTVKNFFIKDNVPEEILELLNESFYLKVSPALSHYSRDYSNQKIEIFKKFVKEWGWKEEKIYQFDRYESWELNDIENIWKKLKKYIVFIYQKIIKELPGMDIADVLSKDDFTIISRKIEIFFAKSPEKVEKWIPFHDRAYESLLYISPKESNGSEEWEVSKSVIIGQNNRRFVFLNRQNSLFKLLVWLVSNHIYNQNITQVKVASNYHRIMSGEVIEVLSKLCAVFQTPGGDFKNNNLLKPAVMKRAFVAVNINDPGEEKIMEFSFTYKTSWDEVYVYHFSGKKGFFEVVKMIQKMRVKGKSIEEKFYLDYFAEGVKKEAVGYLEILRNLIRFFNRYKGKDNIYYIFNYGNVNLLLSEKNNKNIESGSSITALLQHINKNHSHDEVFIGASGSGNLSILSYCLNDKYKHKHALFFCKMERETIYYLLLRSGHIFHFTLNSFDTDKFVRIILQNLYEAFHYSDEDPQYRNIHEKINVYEILYSYRAGYSREEYSASRLSTFLTHSQKNIDIIIKDHGFDFITGWGEQKFFPAEKSLSMIRKMYENYRLNIVAAPFPTKIVYEKDDGNPVIKLMRFWTFFSSVKKIAYKLFQKKL